MNVYDFDNTIYDGESVFDFYMFSLRKHPRVFPFIFVVFSTLIKYKLCRISEEEMMRLAQKHVCAYFEKIPDVHALVKAFWDKNEKKIKPFYFENKTDDDLIITASVDFLLEEIFSRIGVKHYISTKVNTETGEVYQLCYRKNKVSLFREAYPNKKIERFYTDSLNDKAMIEISEKAYLVKKQKIKQFR